MATRRKKFRTRSPITRTARRVDVARIQNAARNAMEWFEVVGRRYADQLEPEQFMYSMLTRSQRISHENLRVRDKAWLEGYERWFARKSGLIVADGERCLPPMFTPFKVRAVTLANRIVVSPMAMYSAKDGLIGDFHLVHLGARAMGGAGLVFAEMTCVPGGAHHPRLSRPLERSAGRAMAPVGRLHSRQQRRQGRRPARPFRTQGLDESRMGRHRSTARAGRLAADLCLGAALSDARPDPAGDGPGRLHGATADFIRSTELAASTDADWLELHCAHGYLLSSFLSPLTNRRDDKYGGGHENRARYPLEVFRAVRAVWPADKPISVRLSCHLWTEGGNTPDDAAIFAAMFKAALALILIDCFVGDRFGKRKNRYMAHSSRRLSPTRSVTRSASPRLRLSAISEADHANSILAAGRADLCAIARPHLADAAWTQHEAAKIGLGSIAWPKQYYAGKAQYEANLARAAAGK